MFSFGHCPNYLSPLLSGNLYIFFGRHKGIYKVYFLIRARPSPSPPHSGNARKKTFFFLNEVFPNSEYNYGILQNTMVYFKIQLWNTVEYNYGTLWNTAEYHGILRNTAEYYGILRNKIQNTGEYLGKQLQNTVEYNGISRNTTEYC